MNVRQSLRMILTTGVLALVFLAQTAAAQQMEILKDLNTATGIRNLDVDGTLYDVDFLLDSAVEIYGADPPIFDFGDIDEAFVANTAVILALNTDDTVTEVGPNNDTGVPDYGIAFEEENDITRIRGGTYIGKEADVWFDADVDIRIPAEPAMYADFRPAGDEPPPLPPPPPPKGFAIDVTGVVDMDNDAVPDVALLAYKNGPLVRYYSGADQKKVKGIDYFAQHWWGVAADTVTDANSNGVANDPAVAVLARKPDGQKRSVEIRSSDDGSSLGKISFLGTSWVPIDVAVINDVDGDGVTGDTAIAVLGYNPTQDEDKKIKVQVRWMDTGEVLANWEFFNDNYLPNALEVVQRENTTPLLAVLATNKNDAAIRVESRRLNKGTKVITTKFFGSSWFARDIAILEDTDGNGNPNDPSIMVLAENLNDNKNKVQIRLASDGSQQKNILMQGASQNARRLTNVDDISGNQHEEVGSLAVNPNDGSESILLVDYDDTDDKTKINP